MYHHVKNTGKTRLFHTASITEYEAVLLPNKPFHLSGTNDFHHFPPPSKALEDLALQTLMAPLVIYPLHVDCLLALPLLLCEVLGAD